MTVSLEVLLAGSMVKRSGKRSVKRKEMLQAHYQDKISERTSDE